MTHYIQQILYSDWLEYPKYGISADPHNYIHILHTHVHTHTLTVTDHACIFIMPTIVNAPSWEWAQVQSCFIPNTLHVVHPDWACTTSKCRVCGCWNCVSKVQHPGIEWWHKWWDYWKDLMLMKTS